MTKEIVAFDLETTGLDLNKDYILQLGLVKFDTDTYKEVGAKCWFIKPETDFEIAPQAQEKTGITKEFILENGVSLRSIWDEAVEFIGDCDMLAYNGLKFDVPMLWNNISRIGLKFNFASRNFYDSLVIERKRNSMKLEDVYKRYTGKTLEGAHDALNDVRGLIAIFEHQKKNDAETMEDPEFSVVSPEGFVRLNENRELVFTSGKYKNCKTNDICEKDPTYIRWVFEKFSPVTRKIIRDEWFAYKELKTL